MQQALESSKAKAEQDLAKAEKRLVISTRIINSLKAEEIGRWVNLTQKRAD